MPQFVTDDGVRRLHQQSVPPAALDNLMAQELRAFDAGAEQAVWLCFGIRPDLHADRGSWARSDWAPWIWGNIVAEDLFDRYADEDRRRCQQVADALVQLDRRAQLFGIA